MNKNIPFEKIEEEIFFSLFNNRPIVYPFELLRFAFGFKRMSGLAVTFKMALTGKSETEAQILPNDNDIRNNIENWAKQKRYFCEYNPNIDSYTFKK